MNAQTLREPQGVIYRRQDIPQKIDRMWASKADFRLALDPFKNKLKPSPLKTDYYKCVFPPNEKYFRQSRSRICSVLPI